MVSASSLRLASLSFALLLSAPVVLSGQHVETAGSDPPQFLARYDAVTVDVTVYDGQNVPITGLTKDDFTILVDRQPRPISRLNFVEPKPNMSTTSGRQPSGTREARPPERARAPSSMSIGGEIVAVERRFVVVVDRENIRAGDGQRILDATGQFILSLPSSDRVALRILPAPTAKLSFDERREAMVAKLGKMEGTFRPIVGTGDHFERLLRARATLDGLHDLVAALQPVPDLTHIVIVSGGAWMDERNLMRVRELAALAAAARTQFHAIHVGALAEPAADTDFSGLPTACNDDSILSTGGLACELARLTGGYADPPSSHMTEGAAFDRFSLQSSAWYVLGFEPSAADRDGRRHDMEVRVKGRPDAKVRNRMSFTAEPTVVLALATRKGLGAALAREPNRVPKGPQEVKPPSPATSWNDAAETRTALGLLPFTWSAEWMDAASRFCDNQRVDAGVEYVCDWSPARVRNAQEWFDYSWEHRASYATPPTWLTPESMRRTAALQTVGYFCQVTRPGRTPNDDLLNLAGSLLQRADTLDTTAGTHKSWATVTAQWLVAVGKQGKALEVARSAASIYPRDPTLHVVTGSLEEAVASPLIHPQHVVEVLVMTDDRIAAALRRASADYGRALDIDPARSDARVRLARVLMLLGKNDEAAQHLGRVLESEAPADTRWLALMLRGRLHTSAGRFTEAVASFELAAAIAPGQTVTIALANALERSGDREGALARLRMLPDLPPGNCDHGCDPWQKYDIPDPGRVNELVKSLVAGACGGQP